MTVRTFNLGKEGKDEIMQLIQTLQSNPMTCRIDEQTSHPGRDMAEQVSQGLEVKQV